MDPQPTPQPENPAPQPQPPQVPAPQAPQPPAAPAPAPAAPQPQPETPAPVPGNSAETGPEEPEPGETPTIYGFDLDPGEQITRTIHRHPLTLVPTFLTSALLIVVAIAFAFGEGRFPDAIPFPRIMVFGMVLIIFVLAAIIVLIGLFVYKRNVLIFTNEHLVQAEQYGLFSHRVSQIQFTRVQDVTGMKKGIAQTIFNFGNVEIESAGAEEKFIFKGAPNPQEIADEALEIHERSLRAHGMPEPTE